jgi:Leucine-rich repeat (LRR) protein
MQDETLKNLSALQHLQTLKLSGSLLGALPHEMGFLEKLRYLNLHGCSNLLVLPESLCSLGNLRYLDMSSCSAITELPPHFGSVLPESLCRLGNLRYLDMSSCSAIKKFPPHFGNLVNLATLNLSSCCELQDLPPHFGNLANLATLNLSSCCELIKLPEDFGNLQKLRVLDLSNCRKLDTLPESFAKLGNLEVLNLSCCHELKDIPELFGNLQHLLVLELSDCHKLLKLPESISKLIFLKELLLSDCWELTALPESFGNLEQLKYLDLSSSHISALPESVCKLVNLEYMNISWCTDLQMLPGNYGNLVKLEELNMSYIGNGHINVPKGMADMSNLKILLADGFISRSWENEEDIVFFDALRGYGSKFIFGETKLGDLNLSDSTLQVGGLGRVQNLVEVEELQLWKRRQLHSLKVNWVYGIGSLTEEELVPQEAVLEKLQPPMKLERFELWCFTISTFPSWMTDIASFLPNLAHLELRYLETCDCLPPLGQLPKLHSLVISDIASVKEVDQRFSGGARPFEKLRNLVIENMQNLEKWHTYANISGDDVEFMFPVLHHVKINRCPKLIFEPLLPRSVSWDIERSNEVLSSGVQPNSHLYCMPTIRVRIKFCTLSSDCLTRLLSLTSLKFLIIRCCKGLDNWSESIGMLTSLKSLDIEMSDVPACLGGVTSLESLRIQNCPVNYSTLEQVLLLTALVDLSICCSDPTKFVNEQEVRSTTTKNIFL